MCAADADAEAVGGGGGELGAVDAGGQQQDARFFGQAGAEFFHAVVAEVAGVGDAAAVWGLPLEEAGVLGEEGVEEGQVGCDEGPVAVQDRGAGLERDAGQDLAGGGVADGGVVLGPLQAGEQRAVAAGDPADPQARQAERLGGDVQRQGALGQAGGLRQGAGRIPFQAADPVIWAARSPASSDRRVDRPAGNAPQGQSSRPLGQHTGRRRTGHRAHLKD